MHIKEINHKLRTYRSFASGNLGGGGYLTMNERLKSLLKSPKAPFTNPFVLKDKNNEIFTVKWNHLAPAENILRGAKGLHLQLFIRTLESMHEGIETEKRLRIGSADDLFKICADHAGSFGAIRDEDIIRRKFISELNRKLPFEGGNSGQEFIDPDLEEIELGGVQNKVKVDDIYKRQPFGKNNFQSVEFWTEGDGKELINRLSPTIIMNQITPLIDKFNAGDHLQAASIYLGRKYNESEGIIIGIAMKIVFDFEITDQKEDVTKNDSETQIMKKNELIRIITRAHLINKIKKNKISEISKDYDR